MLGTGDFIAQFVDDTNIFKVMLCEEDHIRLQRAIDEFSAWSCNNKLDLNANKTYHVSFRKSNTTRIHSTYFIGTV